MTDTIREITELEGRLERAEAKTDPATLQALLADDIVFTGHEGKIFSKQELVEAHEPPGFEKFSSFTVTDLQVKDCGSAAIAIGRMDISLPGFSGALRFTRTWMKRNGQWQAVAAHVSPAR